MRISEFLIKIPYSIAWRIANSQNYSFPVVYYCSSVDDYKLFEPIRKRLPELTVVAHNKKIQEELFDEGIMSILNPVYPTVLITQQDYKFKFPSKKVKKIRVVRVDNNDSKNSETYDYKGYQLHLLVPKTDEKAIYENATLIKNFVNNCGISF